MELLQSSFLKNPDFCKFSNGTCIPTESNRAFTVFFHENNSRRNSLQMTVQRITVSHKTSKRRNSLRKKFIREQKFRNFDFPPHQVPEGKKSQEFFDGSDNDGRIQERNDERGTSHNLELESESRNAELLNKLESWAARYKDDIDYWGIGSRPIFTVFHDSDGNIKEVRVSEGEILQRHKVQSSSKSGNGVFSSGQQKILRARSIASEIEAGNYRFPKDSSIATFFLEERSQSSSVGTHTTNVGPSFLKTSRFGFVFICGFLIIGLVKKFFMHDGKRENELRGVEKEMLVRKIKARKERKQLEKGSIEVLENVECGVPVGFTKRPQLDKEEILKEILRTRASRSNVTVSPPIKNLGRKDYFDDKVLEIRHMAKEARLAEKEDTSTIKQGIPNNHTSLIADWDAECKTNVNKDIDDNGYVEVKPRPDEGKNEGAFVDTGPYIVGEIVSHNCADNISANNTEYGVLETSCEDLTEKSDATRLWSEAVDPDQDTPKYTEGEKDGMDRAEEVISSSFQPSSGKLDRQRSRIILSIEEASKYLSSKQSEQRTGAIKMDPIHQNLSGNISNVEGETIGEKFSLQSKVDNLQESMTFDGKRELLESFSVGSEVILSETADVRESVFINPNSEIHQVDEEYDDDEQYGCHPAVTDKRHGDDLVSSSPLFSVDGHTDGTNSQKKRKSWIEANFHRFEPIVEKIGVGFKDNYMIAREKVQDEVILTPEVENGSLLGEYDEFEWMKDDTLRDIVFRVRENEMAGRDPFHLVSADDQDKFFDGLERKVEKANTKILALHEWIHSRVENLDYGADGISIYDPPEKIIPRWKGPLMEKDPEFINEFYRVRQEILGEKKGELSIEKFHNWLKDLDKEEPLTSLKDMPSSANIDAELSKGSISLNHKTVIESSDGSTKSGKKSGKEYWQHTKKWSEEFLQVYNSETDPEVKAIMKDMGKDLDRWITPKEIQEATDLMDRNVPKWKKKYIEKKLAQFKRECQIYGSQAVADKYREYAEQKEEDYLWWLDLPHVLCIELYTSHAGHERIGFYSLEVGADFELNPKQYHVIALENRTDARHLCYIIQTHMEIIGNGHAFVIAIPPKDAFREAKANGFSVTVIRKGELRLDIDKTLEVVEREIVELGSKMYYDKYIRENEVSVEGIWKGLFKGGKSIKRRPMQTTKSIKG